MWNEFVDGYAEAAEPPRGGGSFGTFRCILAYLGYDYLLASGDGSTINNYLAWTDTIFEIFGISQFSPHDQGPLNNPLYDNQMRLEYMQVFSICRSLRSRGARQPTITRTVSWPTVKCVAKFVVFKPSEDR